MFLKIVTLAEGVSVGLFLAVNTFYDTFNNCSSEKYQDVSAVSFARNCRDLDLLLHIFPAISQNSQFPCGGVVRMRKTIWKYCVTHTPLEINTRVLISTQQLLHGCKFQKSGKCISI